MTVVSKPVTWIKESVDESEEHMKVLLFHIRNLSLMERQFLSGEDMEISMDVLDQWREILSQQRTLIEKLEIRCSGVS